LKLLHPSGAFCSYAPSYNGKAERIHREDLKRFYDAHRFYSIVAKGAATPAPCVRSTGSHL